MTKRDALSDSPLFASGPVADKLPASIRAGVAHGLEAAARAPTLADLDCAIAGLFVDCLPPLLHAFSAVGLLRDYYDLREALTVRLPVLLCQYVNDVLNDPTISCLYSSHVVGYIRRAVTMTAARYHPAPVKTGLDLPAGVWRNVNERYGLPEPDQVRLAILIQDAVRSFAASVLIAGPPAPEATIPERRESRRRRLAEYIAMSKLQGITATFSSACRDAGVARKGKGSGADWHNGKLPDSAKTSKDIEAVLCFRDPPTRKTSKFLSVPH